MLIPVGLELDEHRLNQMHTFYFGGEPPKQAARLYAKFPEYRGFSASLGDRDHFRAVLLISLLSTVPWEERPFKESSFRGTYLLHPKSGRSQVLEAIRTEATEMFSRLRARPEESKAGAIKIMVTCFQKMLTGHQVLQLSEPDRWMSAGFSHTDPIPAWIKDRLLR